jgi:transposase
MVVPGLRPEGEIHLCADKGYRGASANEAMLDRGFTPHIPPAEEDRIIVLNDSDHQPRRWIVEVAHSWFKRFRKLLVRYEKTEASFIALLHLAAAIICWRRVGIIYG